MGLLYNQHLITKVWREADVAISRKKKQIMQKSFLFGLGKHAVLLCSFVFAVDQSSWVLFSPTLKRKRKPSGLITIWNSEARQKVSNLDFTKETLVKLWPPDVKSWVISKDPDAGERLEEGGQGDDREWNGSMASPTRWTWVWASSRRWWRTGKPSVLQSMGFQTVRHDWATEQQQQKNIQFSSVTQSFLFLNSSHEVAKVLGFQL